MNPNHDSYRAYRVFQALWLLFFLFHLLISSPYWLKIGNSFLNPSNIFFQLACLSVLIFALLSFVWPDKIIFFALSLLAFTLVKIDVMPRVPNHIHLTVIITLTFLASFAFFLRNKLSPEERIGEWFACVKPFLQLELMMVYFFAVLHKCNYDFFNPEVSCGASLYHDIAHHYPFLPASKWMDLITVYTSFTLEVIIPILLIIPSTRLIGIVTGLIFHYILALHSNEFIMSFSAEVFALYVLFLPKEYIDKIWNVANRFDRPALVLRRAAILLAGLTVLLFIFLLFTEHVEIITYNRYRLMELLKALTVLAWHLYGLLVIGGALILFRYFRGNSFPRISVRPAINILILFPVLLLINGFSPYLGLKTATTFSMFSNLYVECERNNHFFMPSGCVFSRYLDDIIVPLQSDLPAFEKIIKANERMPYFEFQRLLSFYQHQHFTVEYERTGQHYKLTFPEDYKDDYWTAVPWLSKKLILYRNLPAQSPCPCQW